MDSGGGNESRVRLSGRGEQRQNTFQVFSFCPRKYSAHLVGHGDKLPRALRDEVRGDGKNDGKHHTKQHRDGGATEMAVIETGKFHWFYATTRVREVNRIRVTKRNGALVHWILDVIESGLVDVARRFT